MPQFTLCIRIPYESLPLDTARPQTVNVKKKKKKRYYIYSFNILTVLRPTSLYILNWANLCHKTSLCATLVLIILSVRHLEQVSHYRYK